MAEYLKYFKIDETSVYNDGYIYSFYRALVPTKPCTDSPRWFSFQCSLKNQKDCHVRVNTTANWEFDKRGRKFYQEIIKTGKHNHKPEYRDTTRRLKFYKSDESSVIRNGYTYVFYRELDPPKSSDNFEWRMSYHCQVSANNQESCCARIHTTGEWIVDKQGREYQWGTFKNCEHTHEFEQHVSIRSIQNSQQIQKSNSVSISLVGDKNQYQYDRLDESAMYDDRNECKLDVYDETIIGKISTHNNRKENHCESSKNGVQGNSRAKACMDAQFKKKRQLNVSPKRDIDEEKRHKCNVCHYATNDKYDLTKHLRTHTGERPYKCEKCNYAAAEWHTLVRHERTHSDERPYKCRLCHSQRRKCLFVAFARLALFAEQNINCCVFVHTNIEVAFLSNDTGQLSKEAFCLMLAIEEINSKLSVNTFAEMLTKWSETHPIGTLSNTSDREVFIFKPFCPAMQFRTEAEEMELSNSSLHLPPVQELANVSEENTKDDVKVFKCWFDSCLRIPFPSEQARNIHFHEHIGEYIRTLLYEDECSSKFFDDM